MIHVSFAIHLWWIGAYLAIGVLLWLPLEYVPYRQIHCPPQGFWAGARSNLRRHGWAAPLRILVPVVVWPLAVWETIPNQYKPARRR